LFMIMLVFVYMFIFGSISHIWEKNCGLCVSDPGLLHLIWCPPIASICLQNTYHYSFWNNNILHCVYIPLMFIATLFTIAKLRKQARCSITDEWIKKLWCTYTIEYYNIFVIRNYTYWGFFMYLKSSK
jgi:hypothetical protein